MTPLLYALSSLLWAAAGLAVGYLLGRAGRLEAFMSTPPRAAKQVADLGARTSTRRERITGAIVGLVLIVLALGSVITMSVYVREQGETTERLEQVVACQNAYNDANRRRNAQITEASGKERGGQKLLLDAAFATPPNPAAAAAAYRQYVDLIAQADAQRAANPLPEQDC